MKSGFKYLLLLALCFLKGYGHSFAATPVHSLKQAIVHDVQNQKISDRNDQKDPLYLLLDNLMNDDDDDLISIKGKTSFRNYTSIFTDLFFLGHPFLLRNNLQFYKNGYYLSPDKYIFQRVFRI